MLSEARDRSYDGSMEHITIYAAGEIHSDWRNELRAALQSRGVRATVVGPQEVHERSDSIGEDVLGEQPGPRYRDLMVHASTRCVPAS